MHEEHFLVFGRIGLASLEFVPRIAKSENDVRIRCSRVYQVLQLCLIFILICNQNLSGYLNRYQFIYLFGRKNRSMDYFLIVLGSQLAKESSQRMKHTKHQVNFEHF